MKRIIIFLGLIIWFSTFDAYAAAGGVTIDENVKNQVGKSFEVIEEDLGDIDVSGLLDRLSKGDFSIDKKGVFDGIKEMILKSFRNSYGFFFRLLLIILLVAAAESINADGGMGNAVRLLCAAVISVNMIGIFSEISDYCISVTDKLVLFINSLIPVLIALVAAGGNVSAAGMLNPIMLGASSVVSVAVRAVILPLIFVGFSFRASGAVTGKKHIAELGSQVFSLVKWCTGLVMTVYIGIITIIGTSAPHVDEVTLKTAKYAVSSFVPYVGGMLTDSVELVLNCSNVVKNSVGILGLIGILAVAAVPCVSIAVKSVLLGILSVVSAPVTDSKTHSVIKEVSSCVNTILGMMTVVCVMYIVSVTVIIFVGGA